MASGAMQQVKNRSTMALHSKIGGFLMSLDPGNPSRPPHAPDNLEREESQLWRWALGFMLLLAVALSALLWERLGVDLALLSLCAVTFWLTARNGYQVVVSPEGGSRLSLSYTAFAFAPGDTLLFGRESGGVPDPVHEAADARLRIPLRPGLRSLNLAQAAAMALGEALRQTGGFVAEGERA